MKKILVIASHPDDEILGCGGTLIKHKKLKDKVLVVFTSNGENSRDKKLEDKYKYAQYRNKCALKVAKKEK